MDDGTTLRTTKFHTFLGELFSLVRRPIQSANGSVGRWGQKANQRQWPHRPAINASKTRRVPQAGCHHNSGLKALQLKHTLALVSKHPEGVKKVVGTKESTRRPFQPQLELRSLVDWLIVDEGKGRDQGLAI